MAREYMDMREIYPEPLESPNGNIKVEQFTLTEHQVKMATLRNTMNGNAWMTVGLKPDHEYVRFLRNGTIWMSDTPMEKRSNSQFINKATGRVLTFGLGMGLVLPPLLLDDAVKSITVMELDQEVIDLVRPQLETHLPTEKLEIIRGNAWEDYDRLLERKFETIYFDIWEDICSDNWEEMQSLFAIYRDLKASEDSFYRAWLDQYTQGLYEEEQKEAAAYAALGGRL